ncbi:MAG TPA: mandelate racemase/muconate lactonizing enzyme family protein [Candidatus Thermoplasmatota archaeon]
MSDVDVWPYSLPLKTPWTTGRSRTTTRRGFIVQVGRSYGDACPLPGAPDRELGKIGQQLRAPSSAHRAAPHGPARNALLQAALSEKARETKISLGTLLGDAHGRHPRSRVHVNATIPIMPMARTASRAKALVREGYRTLKLKVGSNPADWKRVEAVRNIIGPSIRLRLDPNGSWSAATLASRLERLEAFDIEYVEQPFPSTDPTRFVDWTARSPIPLAPDEQADSLDAIRTLLADKVLEFVVLKPMTLGGPDLATEAIALIEDAGAVPIVTDVLESGVGRAGALHVASLTRDADAVHGLAGGTYFRTDLVKPALLPKRAQLRVPTRPGLGVTVGRPTS